MGMKMRRNRQQSAFKNILHCYPPSLYFYIRVQSYSTGAAVVVAARPLWVGLPLCQSLCCDIDSSPAGFSSRETGPLSGKTHTDNYSAVT